MEDSNSGVSISMAAMDLSAGFLEIKAKQKGSDGRLKDDARWRRQS